MVSSLAPEDVEFDRLHQGLWFSWKNKKELGFCLKNQYIGFWEFLGDRDSELGLGFNAGIEITWN